MPRETLTRDQIVRAAVELLDADGVEGLSMRRLGARLGSAATAMYWHVGSKENLVVLAADLVWGELELPDPVGAGWRAAARTLVYDTLDLTRRHPWLLSAVSTHLVYGPGMARFQDHAYAIYEAAGFRDWELDWAANAVFTFAAGTALVDAIDTAATTAQAPRGKGESGPVQSVTEWATGIASQYPRLRTRLEAHQGADPAELSREKFAFGVEAILDGLEARLRDRDRGGERDGGRDPEPAAVAVPDRDGERDPDRDGSRAPEAEPAPVAVPDAEAKPGPRPAR
ncbi:TetR/AcrR family transcriptional regulator [Streptomyces kanasensis]|uniref:TetR/AcrR family transcriptional regulator n=1 Tax=Streptomyces kanasensis TaxID=936756 RepID=UPI0037015FAF